MCAELTCHSESNLPYLQKSAHSDTNTDDERLRVHGTAERFRPQEMLALPSRPCRFFFARRVASWLGVAFSPFFSRKTRVGSPSNPCLSCAFSCLTL